MNLNESLHLPDILFCPWYLSYSPSKLLFMSLKILPMHETKWQNDLREISQHLSSKYIFFDKQQNFINEINPLRITTTSIHK